MRLTKSLISAALLSGALASSIAAQTTSPAQRQAASTARLDHRELAADQQIIQALNRLTFGPRPGDAQKVRAMGLDRWIDLQLHPERIDNTGFEQFASRYDNLKQDQNDLLRQFAEAQRERRMVRRDRADSAQMSREDRMAMQQAGLGRRQIVGQLQSARVARAVASNRQLEEVMTDFWLNHFSVFLGKGPPQPYYLVEYERDVIRPNALGKFRDLLGAVAKSPAMLFYLDNARSMADSSRPRLTNAGRAGRFERRPGQARNTGLNENYGRELLELHTLGADGGYTQQDVINVARALTGWTINPPMTGGGFIFRPAMHDAGEKIVLGQKLSAGRGIEDGEDVLDILSRSPATARYIATKLVRRFVADDPPRSLVDDAAAVFLKTNGDIREVVRTIVTSNELYSQRAFRSKVKSPFEVVVSAMRGLNAQPDPTPQTAQAIAFLGQPIYGHQAPNGYPETGDAWMNTGAILNRINFGMAVAANRIPGLDFTALPAIDSLRNAPRQQQVDAVISVLLSGSASPDTRAVLIKGENPITSNAAANPAEMASAESSQNEMTSTIDRPRRANPRALALGPVPQLTGVAQIVGLALGSPEFQRR
ncbi:MAG TPA: DUF1800 domain-containing protein [Gemmatimonadaceae bacterium]|nr:DUF1800 domain-containing protein [Gemmatimonadaceae bacterium]